MSMMMICPRCWKAGGPCDRCNGKGLVPDVQLSQHFTLGELLRSADAVRLKISNDATPLQVIRLRNQAQHLLQPGRDALGQMDASSSFRAPLLNTAVGGSPTSAHPAAWATDIKPRRVSLHRMMRWYADSGLKFDQIILEPSWIHLGWKRPGSGEQRQQLLRKDGNKYPAWEG